ncbi:MAG: hypothetical protein ACT4P7_16355 [Gemmatimonadaceae bacterium]
MMRRYFTIATALLLAGATFWDVYTLASDITRPAPWWQLALGLTDVSLLSTVAGLVWRKSKGAHRVVLGDLFFVLGGALVVVRLDGVSRLVHGFGADEFLSLFLVALAMRVGLYVALVPREIKPATEAA